jgi:hypothetical protein
MFSFDFVEFFYKIVQYSIFLVNPKPWLFNVQPSCTIGLNIAKPPWCTHTHQGLSNGTKGMAGGTVIWEIST